MPVNDDVASVLERVTEVSIENWYGRVEKENDVITVPLSREQTVPLALLCSK
jgi:hypothetical protein